MKKIMSKIWMHKSSINQAGIVAEAHIRSIMEVVPVSYDVIRYDLKTQEIAFIGVEDWNNQLEPVLTHSYVVKPDGTTKLRNESLTNPTIYHQKELFVNEDYAGFNIQEAYKRTETWKALGLPSNKIGRYSYWSEQLADAGLECSSRV